MDIPKRQPKRRTSMAGSSLAQVFFVSANAIVTSPYEAVFRPHVCGNRRCDSWVVINGAQCYGARRLTLSLERGRDMIVAIGLLQSPKW